MARGRIRGGRKLDAFLRNARHGKSVKGVDVGYFSTAKYPNGIPVAAVAAWMDMGVPSRGIPERPFFRNAIDAAKGELVDVVAESVDPATLRITRKVAGKVGASMVGFIQKSITTLRSPANKPSTVKRKGSSNPLLDSATMRNSTTWRIVD